MGAEPLMPITVGIILALACGLAWVAADGLRKQLASRFDALELAVCLHWLQLPFLALLLTAAMLLPSGEWSEPFTFNLKPGYWLPALPTIVCNALANAMFVRALQLSDLSLSVPYLSLTPVMAMITGFFVVGEIPNTLGIIGVMTIGVGALVLNPGKNDGGRFRPIHTLLNERGSLVMLGVGALWSIAVAFDKAAVALSSPLTHAGILAITGGIILEGLRRRTPSNEFMKRFRGGMGAVTVTTGAITLAMFTQLLAYKFIEVAYVEAIKRSIGLVGSVMVGWLIFKESNIAQRMTGVCVMAVGVCLILFAAT